jgi:hypothetical protein
MSLSEAKKKQIRQTTRFLYDLQKLRIASGNRGGSDTADLDQLDQNFIVRMSDGLVKLEKDAEKELKSTLKGVPIWEEWIKDQKGVGVRLAGVILGEIDIHKAPTVSALWRYTGLAVIDGAAERMKKGVKAAFNPWLKAKMVKIMAECLMRANSPWRKFYDNYKTRKENQLVDTCMLCKGTGTFKAESEKKAKPCPNCNGTGGPAPWGRCPAHRHNAAMRYMVKMFLAQLWEEWRSQPSSPRIAKHDQRSE